MKNFKALLTFVTLLTVTLCNGERVSRASDPNDGLVIERKVYAFPSYEKAVQTTDVEKYTSKQAYEKAVNDRRFELQKLKYMSDGLKVVAYLYQPKRIEGKRLPAIIFNRGGAIRGDIGWWGKSVLVPEKEFLGNARGSARGPEVACRVPRIPAAPA